MSKKDKKYNLYHRSLFINKYNYISFLYEDFIAYLKDYKNSLLKDKNIEPIKNVYTGHNNITIKNKSNKLAQTGGQQPQTSINFDMDNIERSELNTLLALDCLHDFDGTTNNITISEYLNNNEYIIKHAKNTIFRGENAGNLKSTLEKSLLHKYCDKYEEINKSSFIVLDNEEVFKKYMNLRLEGDVFIDTTPNHAREIYINMNNKIKKTIATYFDPSIVSQEGKFERYANDIDYFNKALNILKKNFKDLEKVPIELLDSDNDTFERRKFTFKINRDNTLIEFDAGTQGEFSINKIKEDIFNTAIGNRSDFHKNMKKYNLTDNQISSLLILMKGLGDFSQLYFAFILNDKTNLLTMNDQMLFVLGLYCNMNNNFNKPLHLLLGIGSSQSSDDSSPNSPNSSSPKRRKIRDGTRILIYEDKRYFIGKNLRELLSENYGTRIVISKNNSPDSVDLFLKINVTNYDTDADKKATYNYYLYKVDYGLIDTNIKEKNFETMKIVYYQIKEKFDTFIECIDGSENIINNYHRTYTYKLNDIENEIDDIIREITQSKRNLEAKFIENAILHYKNILKILNKQIAIYENYVNEDVNVKLKRWKSDLLKNNLLKYRDMLSEDVSAINNNLERLNVAIAAFQGRVVQKRDKFKSTQLKSKKNEIKFTEEEEKYINTLKFREGKARSAAVAFADKAATATKAGEAKAAEAAETKAKEYKEQADALTAKKLAAIEKATTRALKEARKKELKEATAVAATPASENGKRKRTLMAATSATGKRKRSSPLSSSPKISKPIKNPRTRNVNLKNITNTSI